MTVSCPVCLREIPPGRFVDHYDRHAVLDVVLSTWRHADLGGRSGMALVALLVSAPAWLAVLILILLVT